MTAGISPHELTTLHLRKRLEKVMPDELVAHTGAPDVEAEGIMRHPDVMVIARADMDVPGSFDPRTLIAAIEIVSRPNPDNDWVSKMRDYPLIGIPIYAVFDPRTGTGAVLTDIHATPDGPRYATRKDFVYGEDVTIADWTIPAQRYECPNSADSSSAPTETDPESAAGRSGNGSTIVSSITGAGGWGGLGMMAASEWPPQP